MTSHRSSREPSLGEWACLGILAERPAHGWAVAARLRRDGDIGRIWHLSRPLTYRALDQLTRRGWIEPVAEERGDAAPNRTILAATRRGRSRFRAWLRTPVAHQRDLRSDLLLKLVFAEHLGVELTDMLARQRTIVDAHADALAAASDADPGDVVALWRVESTRTAQRFLDRLPAAHPAGAPRPDVRTERGTDERST